MDNSTLYPDYSIISDNAFDVCCPYNYIVIGPTPNGEDCTQVNENMHNELAENNAYIRQLIRTFGEPPENCKFFILRNTHHDAGVYHEVAFRYKPSAEYSEEANEIEQSEFFTSIENGCENWDDLALQELSVTKMNISETKLKLVPKEENVIKVDFKTKLKTVKKKPHV